MATTQIAYGSPQPALAGSLQMLRRRHANVRAGKVTTRSGTVTAAALHSDLCRASNVRSKAKLSDGRGSACTGGARRWRGFFARHYRCHASCAISRQIWRKTGAKQQPTKRGGRNGSKKAASEAGWQRWISSTHACSDHPKDRLSRNHGPPAREKKKQNGAPARAMLCLDLGYKVRSERCRGQGSRTTAG